MVKFFLLALLVTGLLIGGKVEVWHFPFSLFPSSFFVFRFSLFCVFCVLVRARCRESKGENEMKLFISAVLKFLLGVILVGLLVFDFSFISFYNYKAN